MDFSDLTTKYGGNIADPTSPTGTDDFADLTTKYGGNVSEPLGAGKEFARSLLNVPLKAAASLHALSDVGTSVVGKILGNENLANEGMASLNKGLTEGYSGPLGNVTPIGSYREATGLGIEGGSYLIGGGEGATAVKAGLKGQLLSGALRGAKAGAAAGGVMSFGQALQEAEPQPANIAYQTLFGTLTGGALGGVLGAATPVAVKGINAVKTYTNLSKVEAKLASQNQNIFRPTSGDLAEWNRAKVNPMQTYVKEFGTEAVPGVENDKLDLTNQISQVDARYRAGAEGFNTILRNSPETVTLADRQANAVKNLQDSGLKITQIEQGTERIKNEFDAIRRDAEKRGILNPNDSVPVWYADHQKDKFWGQTKNFGTEESTLANAINRNIGFSFKNGIENVIKDANVRDFNKGLQELIVLRDFLESRNGKVPGTGGKMSRYVLKGVGGTIGTVTGAVGGGPVGAATAGIAGAVTGDKVAQFLIHPETRTWLLRAALKRLGPAERKSLQEQAEIILKQMAEKRANMLKLPPGDTGGLSMTRGGMKPNPNMPTTPTVIPRGGATTYEKGVPQRVGSQSATPITNANTAKGIPNNLATNEISANSTKIPTTPKNTIDESLMSSKVTSGVGEVNTSSKATEYPKFKGFKDLSTSILNKMTGRSEVSKQFIEDLTNSGGVKQAEKDLIRETLQGYGERVPVKKFANEVKTQLLPLKVSDRESSGGGGTRNIGGHENITLPENLRGDVETYGERIYQSPIKTSAGGTHYDEEKYPKYFAHSRIEDMTDGKTRRVIEIQSDLFQKDRLSNEYSNEDLAFQANQRRAEAGLPTSGDVGTKSDKQRKTELAQLEPYKNTWQDRIVREEVKAAAKDGKSTLLFPTGETAMKVEKLGESTSWADISHHVEGDEAIIASPADTLKPDQLKVGQRIARVDEGIGSFDPDDSWIITDVMGDGKFKALPKTDYIDSSAIQKTNGRYFIDHPGFTKTNTFGSMEGAQKAIDLYHFHSRSAETFDISGKVDTNSPVYRFYEKEMGRYLKNKYNATPFKDDKGVAWWKVNVPKEAKKAPIEAFAIAGAGTAGLAKKSNESK